MSDREDAVAPPQKEVRDRTKLFLKDAELFSFDFGGASQMPQDAAELQAEAEENLRERMDEELAETTARVAAAPAAKLYSAKEVHALAANALISQPAAYLSLTDLLSSAQRGKNTTASTKDVAPTTQSSTEQFDAAINIFQEGLKRFGDALARESRQQEESHKVRAAHPGKKRERHTA